MGTERGGPQREALQHRAECERLPQQQDRLRGDHDASSGDLPQQLRQVRRCIGGRLYQLQSPALLAQATVLGAVPRRYLRDFWRRSEAPVLWKVSYVLRNLLGRERQRLPELRKRLVFARGQMQEGMSCSAFCRCQRLVCQSGGQRCGSEDNWGWGELLRVLQQHRLREVSGPGRRGARKPKGCERRSEDVDDLGRGEWSDLFSQRQDRHGFASAVRGALPD
mmetsp:Transcript_13927/g.33115  ORF Transcript_13927/g.33115 Transcript_13927/m.33115 type:complete len:222 (-) Transcript_13927:711-1376(-)